MHIEEMYIHVDTYSHIGRLRDLDVDYLRFRQLKYQIAKEVKVAGRCHTAFVLRRITSENILYQITLVLLRESSWQD